MIIDYWLIKARGDDSLGTDGHGFEKTVDFRAKKLICVNLW